MSCAAACPTPASCVTDSLVREPAFLANRRRFDAVWELEWQRALRQGFPLAIAMIDVDHFKDYNDHCGHQAGDDCLQRLAQVLAAATQRSGELAALYGGRNS